MSTDTQESQIVNVEAEDLKEQGNSSFRSGDFVTALELYTQAIDLDPSNSKYLINRSLCFASMSDWGKSGEDARASIKLAPKATKAHFRLVKSLFELGRFKDARLAILNGLKECGEGKEMKLLEEELLTRTGIPLRPKSTDFEIVGELGDGNFSKVYKALHKSTNKVFAIKTIEKMTVDRMKKRHGNINNEILMEKRALHRLDYPGIVTLYNTFQDYGTLYYQMEYVGGNDLWHRLHEVQLTGHLSSSGANTSGENAQHAQVGTHWSLARFYLAEAINAVEHMHQRGIAHRDIKPENMIITEDGHLKFVDFGTAKDFIHTDLNGPEFVGTPEYLSPSTVRNKKCGVEVDLWALGVVLHQMLLGYTPYGAPSPYLTFLRIKRSFLQIPDWVPAPLASMIRLLLQSDARARLRSACGVSADSSGSGGASSLALGTTKHPSGINYDALRAHEMFSNPHATCPGIAPHAPVFDDLSTVEGVRTVYERDAHKVPSLRELCLRATGRAALLLAAATAENGGVRPKSPVWMQTFNLTQLCPLDRSQIQHYLSRQQRLHTPGVYRLFCSSAVEARARRSDVSTGEYLGLTRGLHGHWDKDFHFVQLASPMVGAALAAAGGATDGAGELVEETQLKSLIASVNKLRPKFLVMVGNLTHASPCDALFDTHVESVRKTMARLSDTIPVIYVPGSRDVGTVPTPDTLRAYRQRFGADYFGFWYGGMRGLVINSSLLISPHGAPEEAARHEIWLTEEIEQCKLCSNSIVVFSHHPWFVADIDEPDSDVGVAAGSGGADGSVLTDDVIRTFPLALRHKWLKKLRHHKVMLAISSAAGRVRIDGAAPADAQQVLPSARPARPFPRKKGSKAKRVAEEDMDDSQALAEQALSVISRPDGEPMRPSEIIAHALSSGELTPEDVTPAADLPSDELPPAPAAAPQDTSVLPPAVPVVGDAVLREDKCAGEVEDGVESEGGDSDSDRESDYEPDESAEKNDEDEEGFVNEDEDYEGPELLPTPLCAAPAGSSSVLTTDVAGLRAVLVREHDMRHEFFAQAALPVSMAELLARLN